MDPGLAPGQPAHQRGRHPARQEGPLERLRPSGDKRLRQPLPEPGSHEARQRCSTRCSTTRRRAGRGDIAAILLTGVPGLNFTGKTQADLLRLNTGIAPSAPVGQGNRLGVLYGDFAGFPNGRRLEDDVTDIELRALTCGYGPAVAPLIEGLGQCAGNANRSPNNSSATAWTRTTVRSSTTFPYVPASRTRVTSTFITPSMGGP